MKRYLFRIITLVCVKMMIPSFLFAGTVFNANAQKITLVYEQVELHKILEEVKRLTSYDFIYKPEDIDGGKKVSLDIRAGSRPEPGSSGTGRRVSACRW